MPDSPPVQPRPTSLLPSPFAAAPRRVVQAPWVERALPLVGTLRGYGLTQLRPDFVAGLTVALFAIPQAMAYALIAGFPPALGLATAIVASILGAAFGSSEFLMNGPTNAISVMLAANAALFAAYGDPVQSIVVLTLMIGAVQLVLGIAGVGSLTRFVSEPVLTGFTAGAGVYIAINQLPAFLGIDRAALLPDLWGFVPTRCAAFDLVRVLRSLPATHATTLFLSLLTFATVRLLQHFEPRLGRRLPAPFIAVVLTTLIVWALGFDDDAAGALRVKVVRDIEPLTRTPLMFRLPPVELAQLRALAGPALAIGLMGSVEAIAIGKQLASRARHPFDASRQLIGEALCNLGAAAVGGFASSGSFSRTAVNFESGAVTRMSCIFSGLLVLVLVLMFAPQANVVPIAALAGTLVHIGLRLVDVARLRVVLSTTAGDRVVLLSTFTCVLFAEHLENALLIGIATSVYYALRRAEGFKLRALEQTADGSLRECTESEPEARALTLLNLQGELFFAAADELHAELLRVLDKGARVIVLRVQEAYNLDATTAHAIANAAEEARRRGGRILLCGVRPGMYGTFERAGLLYRMGSDALFVAEREMLASTRHAMDHARTLLAH